MKEADVAPSSQDLSQQREVSSLLATWGAHVPKRMATLLHLANCALWGLDPAVGLRALRIRLTKTTIMAIVALFVVPPASAPAISAVLNRSSFRAPTLSHASGVSFPALTTAQMYEDYDHFTNIVQQVFPLIEVNRQVYGIDIPALLAQNRRKITGITQARDFVELMHNTMVCCHGSHFCIDKNVHPSEFVKGFVLEGAPAQTTVYWQHIHRTQQQNDVALPLLYFQGNYYTSQDFVASGVSYSKGIRILRCNGEEPDEIVKRAAQSVELYWDYDRNRSYSPRFYVCSRLAADGRLLLDGEQTNGAKITIHTDAAQPVRKEPQEDDPSPLVALVNRDILYIRLPMMDPALSGFYQRELSKHRNESIRKVVIDVRNNPGGSDQAWMDLLGLLIKDDLPWRVRMGVKNSPLVRQYLQRSPYGNWINQHSKVQRIGFLSNEEFSVAECPNQVRPSTNSLKLACKIYVLCEKSYSSAGNLMSLCRVNHRLVSVGVTSGRILGAGMSPFAFSLPHSKLVFSVEPVLDLTDAKNARDTHHVDPEVKVEPSLQQWMDYTSTGPEVGLERRLNEHDPFFRKVLEMD